MMKRGALALVWCGIILLALGACAPAPAPAPISPSPAETPSVPAETAEAPAEPPEGETLFSQISTVTLAGDAVTGDALRGDVLTVLNIWATWCPPCVAELPHLQEVSEAYAEAGVKIVGVMQDGVTDRLEPIERVIDAGETLLADAGAEYAVILPDAAIVGTFIENMQYFPTTFFLDSEGNVVNTVIGSKDAAGWRAEIDATLADIA